MTTQTEQAKATKIAGETTKGTWVTTIYPNTYITFPEAVKKARANGHTDILFVTYTYGDSKETWVLRDGKVT